MPIEERFLHPVTVSHDDRALGIMTYLRDAPPADYVLRIEHFSELQDIDMDKYESAVFESSGYKWKLSLYPNGNSKRNDEGYISFYLSIAETPKDVDVITETPNDVYEITETPKDVYEITETPKDVYEITETPKDVYEITETPKDATKQAEDFTLVMQKQDGLFSSKRKLDKYYGSSKRQRTSTVSSIGHAFKRIADLAASFFNTVCRKSFGGAVEASVSVDGYLSLFNSIYHSKTMPRSPQTGDGIPRSRPDISRGSSSTNVTLLGRGTTYAIARPCVEITFPQNIHDLVFDMLPTLQESSGAKVIMEQPDTGTTDHIIIISGTPDQTKSFQDILHGILL